MATKTATFKELFNVNVSRKIPENEKDITFDHDTFKIFMLLGEEENLLKVYEQSNINKQSFTKAIRKLLRQGLIFKASQNEVVSAAKIEMIKSYLAVYVGPVAELIMADAFEALNSTEDRLPKIKLLPFIDKLAEQVPSEKALEFKNDLEKMFKDNI